MQSSEFEQQFASLTGHLPFPWQHALYRRFTGKTAGGIPSSCSLPTGLGKTSVVAVWLLALVHSAGLVPRRLVYVVNRRTVVDQTTREVERIRENLLGNPELQDLASKLCELSATAAAAPGLEPLAISTLRGQFADNQEWSSDPSRPAVICGTVDMIGSRLLFEGYRIGFKSRPLHAGFLGQDALLVHDEAHLEPAFQKLIESIQEEQKKERKRGGDFPWPGLRVMALSATARSNDEQTDEPFGLTDDEKDPPDQIPERTDNEPSIHHVWRRLRAKKSLYLHPCEDEKNLAADVVERALQHKESGQAILVFLRRVEDAMTALALLKKELPDRVAPLTGTMRGFERDRLVRDNPVFARFMPGSDRPKNVTPAEGTVYLVCTSAGEVGVNLSADHMACDLSTFDSMAQRLGRVNRFGDRDDTRVDVVYPAEFDDKKPNPQRRATLALLQRLNGDASSKALGELPTAECLAAFAPEPKILPATDILFDAWALTTIKGNMPGRPPVAPYLHGLAEWEPRRTSIAWRDEVEVITDELIEREGGDFPQELLADFPLKPHELLSDRSDRVLESLQKLASNHADSPVWLVNDQQPVRVSTLGTIANPAATRAQDKSPLEKAIADGIVLLPPRIGGLTVQGTLDGNADYDPDHPRGYDVADRWLDENDKPRRGRVWDGALPPTNEDSGEMRPMALIRTIDTEPLADEIALPDEEGESDVEVASESQVDNKPRSKRRQFWHWYSRPRDAEDATRASAIPITWDHHTRDVVNRTTEIVKTLKFPDQLKQAVILAANLHDLGKQREIWQRSIGNPNPTDWHAKPGKPVHEPPWRPRHLSDYRHEFGSLLDALHANGDQAARLAEFSGELRDVVLHLIAAHHGYARPHFPPQAYDHERYNTQQNQDAAHEAMRRYARLQRRYGRWGLAYLESLLRAADWAASAEPSPAPATHEAKA